MAYTVIGNQLIVGSAQLWRKIGIHDIKEIMNYYKDRLLWEGEMDIAWDKMDLE